MTTFQELLEERRKAAVRRMFTAKKNAASAWERDLSVYGQRSIQRARQRSIKHLARNAAEQGSS